MRSNCLPARAAVLLGLLALASCASQFVEPAGGDRALLRIRQDTPGATTFVHTYERPNCEGPLAIGILHGSQADADPSLPERHQPKGMLGSAATATPNVIEVFIPAKPITLLFTQHGPHSGEWIRSCKLAVHFDPQANGQYEIAYSFDTKRCYAAVNRLETAGGDVRRDPVAGAKKVLGDCKPYMF